MTAEARTIVEEDAVAEQIELAKGKYRRFQDIWEYGWKWRLARDPLADGVLVEGTSDTYLLRTDPLFEGHGLPQMTVLYRVDDNHVYVLDLRFH